MTDPSEIVFNVPFRGGTLSVRVEAKGQPLSRAHVEKVVRYLELVEEDFQPGPPYGGAAD